MVPTEPRIRCLGLELGGGKSSRTAIVALDFYPSEQKIFILDSVAQLQGSRDETGDEVLLDTIKKFQPDYLLVNAPLSLPPCVSCALPVCPGYRVCTVPEVTWMREEGERLKLGAQKAPTPYTQRPIDVAMRGILQQGLPVDVPVDESLGAGPAPLLARMQYLTRHLAGVDVLEVNPRLVMARLSDWFDVSPRQLKRYRDLSEGFAHRMAILRAIGESIEEKIPQLFLYEEDMDSLCRELAVFDAFICAFVGIYKIAGLTESKIPGFHASWAMSLVPKRRLRPAQSRARVGIDD